jgi:hypothetical protein
MGEGVSSFAHLLRPPKHGRAWEEFKFYFAFSNLFIDNLHKWITLKDPEFVQYYLLTFGAVCGMILVSRGGSHPGEEGPWWTNCGGPDTPT